MTWEDYIRLKGQQLAGSMGGVYGMSPPPQQPMPKQNYYPMDMPPRELPQEQQPRQFKKIQDKIVNQQPISANDIKTMHNDNEEDEAHNVNNKAGGAEGSYSGS